MARCTCGASFGDGYGDSDYSADDSWDELDADWKKIRIDQAIGDPAMVIRTPMARIPSAAFSMSCGRLAPLRG